MGVDLGLGTRGDGMGHNCSGQHASVFIDSLAFLPPCDFYFGWGL